MKYSGSTDYRPAAEHLTVEHILEAGPICRKAQIILGEDGFGEMSQKFVKEV